MFKCIIKGRVQGVWYRKHIADASNKAGYRGYIKNLSNGSVEAVADINSSELENFKKILLKGSPLSRVDAIECMQVECSEKFDNFRIIK